MSQQASLKITDLYTTHADDYKKYRQAYPRELFDLLSSLTGDHNLALDVATGNGQSACRLADYYKSVVAIDKSTGQLEHADRSKPNVVYKHLPAELTPEMMAENGFEPHSFDLIAVATAVHWFDVPEFNKVVQRLLKPTTGLYAAWCWDTARIEDKEVRAAFERCWWAQAEAAKLPDTVRRYHLSRYAELEFPFDEVKTTKTFELVEKWDQEHFFGYVRSLGWTNVVPEAGKPNPMETLQEEIRRVWKDPKAPVNAYFSMFMRMGRCKDDVP